MDSKRNYFEIETMTIKYFMVKRLTNLSHQVRLQSQFKLLNLKIKYLFIPLNHSLAY